MTKFNPRHTRNNRKEKFTPISFSPMKHILGIIKAHFDSKAFFTKSKVNGQLVIRYRQENGERITVGQPSNSRLVNKFVDNELTEAECIRICKDLGVWR